MDEWRGTGRAAVRHGRRALAGVLLAVMAIVASAPETTAEPRRDQPSAGCVQAVDSPLAGGLYVDSSAAELVVGLRCRYVSTATGGYLVDGRGSWRVRVERPDGTTVTFGDAHGSPG